MSHKNAKNPLWEEVKKRFQLSDKHLKMAKQLGLNPQKIGNYAPNKHQRWKKPLPQFIEKIFAKQYPQSDVAKELRAERRSSKAKRRALQRPEN